MHAEQEPIQLIRHAMAKHIKEVAQELLYWMEELNKLDHEGVENVAHPDGHRSIANT